MQDPDYHPCLARRRRPAVDQPPTIGVVRPARLSWPVVAVFDGHRRSTSADFADVLPSLGLSSERRWHVPAPAARRISIRTRRLVPHRMAFSRVPVRGRFRRELAERQAHCRRLLPQGRFPGLEYSAHMRHRLADGLRIFALRTTFAGLVGLNS